MSSNLTVEQLRAELSKRGLDTTGVKAALVARLDAAIEEHEYNDTTKDGTNIDGKNDKTNNSNSITGSGSESISNNLSAGASGFSSDFKVRDVENLIQPFSGDNGLTVITWFKEFEEIAVMMNWSAIEKFIYLKRSLVGSAKIFVRTIACKSYADLKLKLINEFERKICKADIYERLQNRKKNNTETFREYVYKMQEIASAADVDDLSLIHYIISGISDRDENKTILYSATNLGELKDKLDIYERIKNKVNKNNFSKSSYWSKHSRDSNKPPHCFNCGSVEHKRKDCRAETKCFKCNGRGHTSQNCPGKIHSKQTNYINTQNIKTIQISGCEFKALVDTGSDLTLIREDAFGQLQDISLTRHVITLLGLGTGKSQSMGCFEVDLKVDNILINNIIHVVPRNSIRFQCILGSDVISKARVLFDKDGITFYDQNGTLEENASIMNITVDDNSEMDIPSKYKDEIGAIIKSYKPSQIADCPIKMKVVLNNETPIYTNPRRLPLTEKLVVKQQIKEWLQEGIIRPSNSPFASNLVITKKKDGSHRVCVDYRRINKETVKEHFPMPIIDDILDKLTGSKIFTTLDLKNGYFHVPLEESSIKYTAFITSEGHFELTRVPFGLTNAPAVFCRFIHYIFRELTAKNVVETYMDDLIISSRDEQENISKLKSVLKVAAQHGLQIKWPKCSFLKQRIDFLGHVVQDGTVSPSEGKLNAVRNFPEPKNVRDLRAFLGLTGFFRKFIASYSVIAKPLTALLQKESPFKIQAEERRAIETLKNALITKPVLHIFRLGAKTELHTDASKVGCAAVLLQLAEDNKLHPVYFYSRKNQSSEENYHSYILEVMAIYLALKKFRIYLLGTQFKIVTDCIAFRQTMGKRDLPTVVSRWILYMQEFQFEVEHRTGKKMQHVDSLSRNPVIYTIQNELLIRIKKSQETDDFISAVKEILKQKSYDDFFMEGNLLFKYLDGKKLLVVPKIMESEIIKLKHEEGHFAAAKTIHLICQEFFIPKLESKVINCINNCMKCLLACRKAGKQEGLLNPLDKGDQPLETIHLDHIGPMDQTAKQYKYILTVVDAFSKYVWIYPTKTVSSEEVIRKLREQQQYFGNPKRIISDRGTAFTAKVFEDFCTEEGIEHILITTGVPRGNGQAERMNRIIIEVLRKLSAGSPEKWYKFVPQVQIALNSTFQRSIRRTPFEVLFGVKMRKKDDLDIIKAIEEAVLYDYEEERDKIRLDVRKQIEKIRQENCKTFNKFRKESKNYEVGDLVAIKKTQFNVGNKLSSQFLGPYEVISKGRCSRYTVQKMLDGEGPKRTTTSADLMKPWRSSDVSNDDISFEPNEEKDGRM